MASIGNCYRQECRLTAGVLSLLLARFLEAEGGSQSAGCATPYQPHSSLGKAVLHPFAPRNRKETCSIWNPESLINSDYLASL